MMWLTIFHHDTFPNVRYEINMHWSYYEDWFILTILNTKLAFLFQNPTFQCLVQQLFEFMIRTVPFESSKEHGSFSKQTKIIFPVLPVVMSCHTVCIFYNLLRVTTKTSLNNSQNQEFRTEYCSKFIMFVIVSWKILLIINFSGF